MTERTVQVDGWDQLLTRWRQQGEHGRAEADCAALMEGLYRHLEGELQGLDRSRIACGPGCASCCVVQVSVLMPEAIALARYVRQIESSHPGAGLRARVGALHGTLGGRDEQARLSLQLPCAFLSEQGSCLIYPLRPLMCRSVTSTDPASCRAALSSPDAAEAPPVVMQLQQKQLCDQAFIALADALREQGLDDRSTSLHTAAYQLLRQPELAAAWLQGGPVPQGG